MDINLPDADGFEICSELRKTSTTPVIFASARVSETDRITGFDIGGDDYLPKPYFMKELLSRINVDVLTASRSGEDPSVDVGHIALNAMRLVLL